MEDTGEAFFETNKSAQSGSSLSVNDQIDSELSQGTLDISGPGRLTRSKVKGAHPVFASLPNTGRAFLSDCGEAYFTLDDEPQIVTEAQKSVEWPHWEKAMTKELEALEKNRTWEIVEKPEKAKLVKNR